MSDGRLITQRKQFKSDILIRKESVVEAAGHAAKRYRSTLAVFILDEVLSSAIQIATDSIKQDNKNQSKLNKMILMSYNHPDIGKIKLTVGVRLRTQDKVQYGITALERGESIQPLNKTKQKKAPHRK